MQRNRLIAASADATVVLEAGVRSGSLNTAGHAAALGRPLGAVPGPVTSPASAGCHRLLREYDAVCVVDADQMAELAGGGRVADAGAGRVDSGAAGVATADSGVTTTEPAPDLLRVTDALSTRSPRGIDDIVRRTGMSVHEVMGVLGVLEVNDAAMRHSDGWVRRRSS
ncbi:DNA-processing protein DprA [Agromyces sp. NPDC058484]|uniref:DNA-processing protein DprA n=1 Tax=Agromyces sp. NPDC058484 TaxID=3346524 RepID=UPI003662A31B